MRRLTLMMAALLFAGAIKAQVNRVRVELGFEKESAVVNEAFADNGSQLTALKSLVGDFVTVPVSDRYLMIYSAVTPDELTDRPKQLATDRAQAAHRLFDSKLREVSKCDAHAIYREEVKSWSDVLKAIRKDPAVPAKDELIQTLETIINSGNVGNAAAVQKLQAVADGGAYQYLVEAILPALRRVSIVAKYLNLSQARPQSNTQPAPIQPTPVQTAAPDTTTASATGVAESEALRLKHLENKEFGADSVNVQRSSSGETSWGNFSSNLALKTNALYDLALLPNIGVEWAFANRWSVSADWMYAWWSHDSSHRYWRAYGGNLELRHWLAKRTSRRLKGHHVGAYAGALVYDVEFGGTGYQSAKWNYMAGLSYGYSIPIAKRLNIDFNIGIGYLWGNYYKYDYNEDAGLYFWEQTKKRRWFGPTRVECSLVWLLGKQK